ncbi:hypothetical protein JCM17380_24650 [Desulfosporosinus burensis]
MKSNKNLSNILFFNLILLVTILGDLFKNFLPLSFIIILIAYFLLSLGLLTNDIIHKKINLLFSKITLLSIILVMGYADFYFKLSRQYSHVFKDNMILSAIDSIYFSITTFTTTGYGDIYPISNSAKMFVASEMIFGYILSTFIMAILVIKFMDEK